LLARKLRLEYEWNRNLGRGDESVGALAVPYPVFHQVSAREIDLIQDVMSSKCSGQELFLMEGSKPHLYN